MTSGLITLVPNVPLDMEKLGDLLSDKDELHLVWPDAEYPFDPKQWGFRFTAQPKNTSYFIHQRGETIGHAALLETQEPGMTRYPY